MTLWRFRSPSSASEVVLIWTRPVWLPGATVGKIEWNERASFGNAVVVPASMTRTVSGLGFMGFGPVANEFAETLTITQLAVAPPWVKLTVLSGTLRKLVEFAWDRSSEVMNLTLVGEQAPTVGAAEVPP